MKKKNLALFGLSMAAVLLCVLFVIFYPKENDTLSYMQGSTVSAFGDITARHSLVEVLDLGREAEINELTVGIDTRERVNQCQVDFVLYKDGEEVFRHTVEDAAALGDSTSYTISDIHVAVEPGEQVYLLITSPDATGEDAISVTMAENVSGHTMYAYDTESGEAEPMNGAVYMTVTYHDARSGAELTGFTIGVGVAAAIFAAAILALLVFTSRPPEMVTALAALLLGLLYMAAMTPHSVPDETAHFRYAYTLSSEILHRDFEDSEDHDGSMYWAHYNVKSGYVRQIEQFNQADNDDAENDMHMKLPISYFVHYLPQTVGITLARLTNQNPVRTFLLGRLCNLLFYTACVYFAVKRMPKFKLLLSLVCLMPMALHQAASYSYDSFINGMSFILIASIVKELYGSGTMSVRDYLWILVPGMLLAPAKVIYTAILLLALLIPAERFGGMKRKVAAAAIAAGACAIMIGVFMLKSVLTIIEADGEFSGLWECYGISFVLAHPLRTAGIFAMTLASRMARWVLDCVGKTLSGLTLPVPAVAIMAYIALMLLSAQQVEGSQRTLRVSEKTLMLFISACIVLMAMASMFFGWTHMGANRVEGVQGRYFIPCVPLVLMAFNNETVLLKKKPDKLLSCGAVLVNVFTVMYVLEYTL